MIAIIDYDAGNTQSIAKAVQYLGETAVITKDGKTILAADKVILPGVGAFGEAMRKIRSFRLEEVIRQVVKRDIPLLGICLGLHLLFEASEESPGISGLGLLKGRLRRIPAKEGLKIPHVGWNSLRFPHQGRLFREIEEGFFAYFVHSYYLQVSDEERQIVTAVTRYGIPIHAAVEKGNLFACQFHPEKSSAPGIKLLENFIHLSE